MTTRLKKEYIDLIKENPKLIGNIADAMGKVDIQTVLRWLRVNHEKLTLAAVLNCIREYSANELDQPIGPEVELTYETNVVKA